MRLRGGRRLQTGDEKCGEGRAKSGAPKPCMRRRVTGVNPSYAESSAECSYAFDRPRPARPFDCLSR